MGLAPLRLRLLIVPAPKIAGQIYEFLKVSALKGSLINILTNKLNIIEEVSAVVIGCIQYASKLICPARIDIFVSNLFEIET